MEYKFAKDEYREDKYHEIANLERDGYIYADGSLRFKFVVKKQNLLRENTKLKA